MPRNTEWQGRAAVFTVRNLTSHRWKISTCKPPQANGQRTGAGAFSIAVQFGRSGQLIYFFMAGADNWWRVTLLNSLAATGQLR